MRTRVAICLAILLWCGHRAFALNPTLAIRQYSHTAWTIRDGAFSSQVQAIAQTPDGYLWLGTESGLHRFDGVRIVRWQPRGDERLPSPNILKLLAARDGRLWIGTVAGLASWKDGRLVTYPELAGEPVASLVEDSASTVWAGTISAPHAHLCAIRSAVECSGQDGRFGRGVFSLLEEGGRLWVASASGVWRWTPGDPRRYPTPTPNVAALAKVGDGPLLVATPDGIRQLAGDTLQPFSVTGLDSRIAALRLLVDRDRGVWIGVPGRGLMHLHDGRTDAFTRVDGLSGDSIAALFEDREGNIWVGTNEGLDRFRELAVTVLSGDDVPTAVTSSVLRARDGSVWIGTTGGLVRWNDGRTTVYRTREGLPADRIGTLFEDSAGRIFVATLGGMAVFDHSKLVPLSSVSTRIVYAIAEGRPGEFWISDQDHGLIHLAGNKPVTRTTWSALGRDDHATALVFDRARAGLWLGFYKGGVVFVQNGTIRASYGTADGLGAGRVSQLQFDSDGRLWAATAAGLSRFDNNRVATLTVRNGLPCDGVHWTIADMDRARWLSMPCGLARITSAEVASWIANPDRSVTTTLLDSSDGVRTVSIPIGFNPPAARVADGRLWFAASNGVGVVDPRHLPFNALPPAVSIEQIVADRRTYDIPPGDSRVVLPALTHDIQIDYTALSLVAPEKMRFRYKLENKDRDWQDVGRRRQAFYNDLRPGNYRFRVTASNNSGIWNEAGTFLDFSVAPAYYQTTWFLVLSAGMMLGFVWAAHRVRLRIVEKHEREISALNERLMKAQEQERVRIAGELHDGVMQDMLAATMMLGTAKRRIPADSGATATIDKVQQKLIQAGTDLRQLSHDLHPPLLQDAGLPGAVNAYCEEFSATWSVPVSCDTDDGVRDLSRGAALALFRILQEALGNAAKHAAARRITVRLTRSESVVCLIVSDDGAGFDRSRLASGGGLGLVMMRERASQLDGTFAFETAPGRGTVITVTIPFR
jgi:signal transduction histidine kinase/ligand-binding sensor domain-containing protein